MYTHIHTRICMYGWNLVTRDESGMICVYIYTQTYVCIVGIQLQRDDNGMIYTYIHIYICMYDHTHTIHIYIHTYTCTYVGPVLNYNR